MRYPVVVFDKKKLSNLTLPHIFSFHPVDLRKFCTFVLVETEDFFICGSGTLTEAGILTAGHIISVPNIQEILAFLFITKEEVVSLPIKQISFWNIEEDLAVLKVSVFSNWNLPIKIGSTSSSKANIFYAFGCPLGVFGQVWGPEIISENEKFILSRGQAIPGVSGGGIFTKVKGSWVLIGVHIFARGNVLFSRKLA